MEIKNVYGKLGLFRQDVSVLELPEQVTKSLKEHNINTAWDLFDKTCSQLKLLMRIRKYFR